MARTNPESAQRVESRFRDERKTPDFYQAGYLDITGLKHQVNSPTIRMRQKGARGGTVKQDQHLPPIENRPANAVLSQNHGMQFVKGVAIGLILGLSFWSFVATIIFKR